MAGVRVVTDSAGDIRGDLRLQIEQRKWVGGVFNHEQRFRADKSPSPRPGAEEPERAGSAAGGPQHGARALFHR